MTMHHHTALQSPTAFMRAILFLLVVTTALPSLAETSAAKSPPKTAIPAGMFTKTDAIEGITWYHAIGTPQYQNVNNVRAYYGVKAGKPTTLRMVVSYTGSDWLFVEKAIFVADGTRFETTGGWERDHRSSVWEWLDVPANIPMLAAISSAKKVTLRYEGQKYIKDRTLSPSEQKAIATALKAYAELTAKK